MTTDGIDEAMAWRVEEACANAYPCWRELRLGGWLLRAAGGRTRRINSVNPLHANPGDPASVVEQASRVYGRLGRATVFRVPDMVAATAAFDRLGFVAEGRTLTLMAVPEARREIADVSLATTPADGWYTAWAHLRPDLDQAAVASYRRSVDALLIPAAFACRMVDGAPVSVSYAALDRGVAVLESVVTDAAYRGQGHARAVVQALVGWAASAGAEAVCLQVAADNHAALALYRSTGFRRELYGYHYCRSATATGNIVRAGAAPPR